VRVLVFGNAGQLGRDLMKVLGQSGEVHGYDLPEVSVTDPDTVRRLIREHTPEAVVNAAAYTDVEGSEDHAAEAFAVNEGGARIVAGAAREADLPVLHIGTDFVFDGTQRRPYTPDDTPNPLSVYGRSKLAGDRAVMEANPRHFILRTAWLYGPGGNNFPEKILSLAEKHATLRVVHDEMGSPTHTWDLAEAVSAMLDTQAYGVYHAVNAGETTRDAFARAILRLAGTETPVEPCASDEFPTKAQRPAYSVLSTASLEAACGYTFRPWEAALAHYIERRAAKAAR